MEIPFIINHYASLTLKFPVEYLLFHGILFITAETFTAACIGEDTVTVINFQ